MPRLLPNPGCAGKVTVGPVCACCRRESRRGVEACGGTERRRHRHRVVDVLNAVREVAAAMRYHRHRVCGHHIGDIHGRADTGPGLHQTVTAAAQRQRLSFRQPTMNSAVIGLPLLVRLMSCSLVRPVGRN